MSAFSQLRYLQSGSERQKNASVPWMVIRVLFSDDQNPKCRKDTVSSDTNAWIRKKFPQKNNSWHEKPVFYISEMAIFLAVCRPYFWIWSGKEVVISGFDGMSQGCCGEWGVSVCGYQLLVFWGIHQSRGKPHSSHNICTTMCHSVWTGTDFRMTYLGSHTAWFVTKESQWGNGTWYICAKDRTFSSGVETTQKGVEIYHLDCLSKLHGHQRRNSGLASLWSRNFCEPHNHRMNARLFRRRQCQETKLRLPIVFRVSPRRDEVSSNFLVIDYLCKLSPACINSTRSCLLKRISKVFTFSLVDAIAV